MTEDEFRERLDRHMGLMEGHVGRMEGHIERGDARWARVEDAMERNRIAFEDLRGYLRMATDALSGLAAEIRENRVDTRDLREESRVQREALWRILGRLDRRPPGPQPA